jgi:hypothetical protein
MASSKMLTIEKGVKFLKINLKKERESIINKHVIPSFLLSAGDVKIDGHHCGTPLS